MANYRTSRNIEASIIDYIKEQLIIDGWNNINVEKTFARVFELDLPTICVRLGNTIHNRVEIGSDNTKRNATILIDLFCTSDGQRLDLKDWLIKILKHGCPYYQYTIINGIVDSKIEDGRLKILNILDTGIDLGVDKNKLEIYDRYRHLITLSIATSKVED